MLTWNILRIQVENHRCAMLDWIDANWLSYAILNIDLTFSFLFFLKQNCITYLTLRKLWFCYLLSLIINSEFFNLFLFLWQGWKRGGGDSSSHNTYPGSDPSLLQEGPSKGHMSQQPSSSCLYLSLLIK